MLFTPHQFGLCSRKISSADAGYRPRTVEQEKRAARRPAELCYRDVVVGTTEYSWCNPPNTGFARTRAPGTHRCRASALDRRTEPRGGPGTPGPNAL